MMISTRGRYALRVMLDMAEHGGGEWLCLRDIAQRQQLSKKYLESIAEVAGRCGSPVRLRAGVSQCKGLRGRRGRGVYRHGERPEGRICRHGAQVLLKLVTPHDHKFAALHGAVWSGGSFVYVPKGVHLSIPLQSYFRLNAKGAGQFEHTLIIVDEGASLHFIEGCSAPKYNVANLHAGCVELYVKKGAKLRYSTIENWSKNMYNLNTKRALVEEGGTIEWVSGSFGSHVGCLYPMSILKGDNSRMEFTGVTFAGAGQDLDTGAKVVHVGKNTSSYMNTRSISKSGGVSTFRSSVGDGCAISQASADIMLGMIVGKQKDAALKLGETFLKMI